MRIKKNCVKKKKGDKTSVKAGSKSRRIQELKNCIGLESGEAAGNKNIGDCRGYTCWGEGPNWRRKWQILLQHWKNYPVVSVRKGGGEQGRGEGEFGKPK